MKRTEFVKSLIAQGLPEDELIAKVIAGDEANGIKPINGTDAKKRAFAKLQIGKQKAK